MSKMEAEFDICTAYGLKAESHPEETSQTPEATNTGRATVSTMAPNVGPPSLQSVYHDVRRLMSLAFPGHSGTMWEIMAFVESLGDPALRL